jgi:hypothetical protein
MGITRGQFQIDYNCFFKKSLEQYIFYSEITPGKLEAKHYNLEMTIYTKQNMVIAFHCLGGETSSYKVVRAVRFARPCDMMLSRNAGAGPYKI